MDEFDKAAALIDKNFLEVREAAIEAGVTRQALYYAIAAGRLKAVKIGKTTYVKVKDIGEYEPDPEKAKAGKIRARKAKRAKKK